MKYKLITDAKKDHNLTEWRLTVHLKDVQQNEYVIIINKQSESLH